eukprot:TRINITY_DN7119_c0_g1_i1.p1 TRINITY_DN7119_c0_g1~~TRINITY_DN7119_c0_g1_i1.p1  ORF type:complete len:697 (+),score=232.99 TRINITY_DN7119_c0_g1_i1:84-2174(+)
MKTAVGTIAFLTASAVAQAKDTTNPVGKAQQLLEELSAKITKDGEAELKAYREYETWCATAKQEQEFAIQDAKDGQEEAAAQMKAGESASEIAADKIQTLSGSISKNENELSDATAIRKKENDDYIVQEQELKDTVEVLGRAIAVLQKELKRDGSALLQKKVNSGDRTALLASIKQVLEAAALSSHDSSKIMSFAQSDESDDLPEADAYEQQSGGILEVLQDLEEKAENELVECRKAEAAAKHQFDMLAQSLNEELEVEKGELQEQNGAKSEGDRQAAAGKSDNSVATKERKQGEKTLNDVTVACADTQKQREESVKNRASEQEAIATALKALEEYTGKAVKNLYGGGAPAFIQVSAIKTPKDLANVEVEEIVRKVAKQDKSAAMAQLSRVVSKAARMGSGQFDKISELINGIIGRLEEEGKNDNSHKEYCDTEIAKTSRKAAKLELDSEKYQSRRDIDTAKKGTIKGQIEKAQAFLVKLAEEQTSLDSIRNDEKKAFDVSTKDVKNGLEGVRVAIKVLREYYAGRSFVQINAHVETSKLGQPATPIFHSKSGGESRSILGMLEVVESDMSKAIATAKMEEDAAIREYDKMTQENRENKAMKSQDVSFSQKAVAELEKDLREHQSDLDTTKTEQETTAMYMKQIQEACANTGPTYEERKAAREMEIANLKEALTVITAQAPGLLQISSGKALRGKK